MERADDFAKRRQHLAGLSDQELKDKFWDLAKQVVTPIVEAAKTQTSPSIERSVLLRMGFSSIEAKGIVDNAISHGYLGKGAGHAVVKLAEMNKIPYREAGIKLAAGEGWDVLKGVWQ
ncbi:ornithine aminomutase [Deltaproteobacteria bacterium Smac51]|nr:ornithine aminomutase [Deltaproteobacteria bacterium Smac51]